MKKVFLLLSIFCFSLINAQDQTNRKTITTTRVSKAPKIDGNLNDKAWKGAEVMTDFIEMRPDNGKQAHADYKTEVKVVYDDKGVYISAVLFYPDVNNIPMQYASRDNFGQVDFFSVIINPNDDGQNGFEFIVQSTGNQADAKISNGNEDFNWSAVWESNVKTTDKGLNIEMTIPYRALRFSNQPTQSWGFNFHRKLENLNSQYTWNHIDNTVGSWTQYDGLVKGFENLKPPTRLSFYPYASITSDTNDGVTENDWSLGMDVKYGLSENFTLDATLIPDFSQAGFDDVQLNLGPFEQQFSEQRQFFTEGTDLFSKGRLFYSRRVGGSPIGALEDIDENIEEYTDYPRKVTMLNAVKISGRTKSGLGIGFFNAITEETKATVRNTDTEQTREVITNPLSNYNILVLDQLFNKNSSITLINTNVLREGEFRDANATGLLYNVKTKNNKYFIDGSVKMTSFHDVEDAKNGYTFDTSIGKIAGNWTGEIGYRFEDENYNPNDLGILFGNNEQRIYSNISYRTLKPKGDFNSYQINSWFNSSYLHSSGTHTGINTGVGFQGQLKKRLAFGGNINYSSKRKDFNEPREGNTSGIFFQNPARIGTNQWVSTNYQKKFAVDYNQYYNHYLDNNRRTYGFNLSPRYRLNNQLAFFYSLNYRKSNYEEGYAEVDGEVEDEIIFGKRNRKSVTNSLSSKYSFSVKSSLSLTFRHNWETVTYNPQFYDLTSAGGLTSTVYSRDNVNFNSWNLDLNYTWQFAPGSQLTAFYRNSIFGNGTDSKLDFQENIDELFSEPKQHLLSLRFVYFIDYNNVKDIF
jgi:hypothetical protein